MTQPTPPHIVPWTPAPSGGVVLIFSPGDRSWLFTQQIPQQEKALDLIWQKLGEIVSTQQSITQEIGQLRQEVTQLQSATVFGFEVTQQILSTLAASQEQLLTVVDGIRAFQQVPVRGHVILRVGKDNSMTIPVHPSDTLDATVAWENAENQTIPETSPTEWSVTDSAGAAASIGTFAADPANDDHAVSSGSLSLGDFILVATTTNERGTAVVAKSDVINVSDTNVATGVVAVTVTPGA